MGGNDSRLRIGIDATPLLGARSGVGRYVEGLLSGLQALDVPVQPVLTTFSLRGARPAGDLAGAVFAPRRLPARLLEPLWARGGLPPVEVLTGRISVFHATNFVLPPSRSPGVVAIHDLAYLHHAETVAAATARYVSAVPRSIERSEAVICFTEAVKSEICDAYGVDDSKVWVIPHGVDARWGAAAPATRHLLQRLGIPDRYLLAVGTLEPRKNLGLLVRAHAAARARDASVPQLVLIGGTGWGDTFGSVAPDPKHVILAGRLPDGEMQALVASARAVCMPSRYEGFGLPVLEALAAGRPVLASDIAAHREVGGRHVTYIPADPGAWIAALSNDAADSPRDIADRQGWAQRFTWRASATKHLELYRRVAG